MKTVLTALAFAALAGAAHAEVAETLDNGFILKSKAELAVPPARAYAAIAEIGKWWTDSHTYSGKASNLTLTLQPGACYCESLPGGGVQHGRVVMASPSLGVVRLDAPLGPLQEMGVSAAWTFSIKPAGSGSTVEMTYSVGGGRPGFGKMFASGVDGVMSEAFARYVRYAQTGKAN